MTRWTEYHTPRSVEAALNSLGSSQHAAIVAGGTDLLLDIDQGRHPPVSRLVDISRIDELHQVERSGDYLVVGAGLPLARLLENEAIAMHAPGLIEACKLIGGPQVRNVATLGGNVAHALPAGDGTIALLSLRAEACLAADGARRWLPLPDLFTGPGQVSFDRSKEILTHLRFHLRGPGEGSAFRRVMRPQGVAIAILNMGVWLRCAEGGEIESARVALGPGGPKPFLAEKGSDALLGHQPDDAVLQRAAQAIMQEASFRTSRHRSTQAYREHLVESLLRETLSVAYARGMNHQDSEGL